MMSKYLIHCLMPVLFLGCTSQQSIDYFGQNPPTDTATVFAKGIISLDGRYEQNIAFSPNGKECFLTISQKGWEAFTMLKADYSKNKWSEFDTIFFSKGVNTTLEPFYVSDTILVFTSNAPPSKDKWDTDIWKTRKINGEWSTPTRLGKPINKAGNTMGEWFPSVSDSGNLYFVSTDETWQSDIYTAKRKGTGFSTPEKLDSCINSSMPEWEPLIGPDESFLLFASRNREDTYGGQDFYVSFRDSNGNWGKAIHLGLEINSEHMEQAPSLSPDGKYLFFGRLDTKTWDCDLHWIDMKFLLKYKE